MKKFIVLVTTWWVLMFLFTSLAEAAPFYCPLPRQGYSPFFTICEGADSPNGRDGITHANDRILGLCQMRQNDLPDGTFRWGFQGPEWNLSCECDSDPGECEEKCFPEIESWDYEKCVKCVDIGDVFWDVGGGTVTINQITGDNWWSEMQSFSGASYDCGVGDDRWSTRVGESVSKIDFKFEIYEDGGTSPIIDQTVYGDQYTWDGGDDGGSCQYNDPPNIACYRQRDPQPHHVTCDLINNVISGIDFQSRSTYELRVWVRRVYGDETSWREYEVCSAQFTAPGPPVCENLEAVPASLPYFGGTVDLTVTAIQGDGGVLTYVWGSDGGDLSGYDDATPETAVWSIPQNHDQSPITYNAWVMVNNSSGASGCDASSCTPGGEGCTVPVTVSAFPENDLSCDDLTVSPAGPDSGDTVSFTCIGTSQLIDASGSPYPITRIDFRVYLDSNGDSVFQADEIIREGGIAPSGAGPSWTATYNPDPSVVVGAGYYGAASRVCILYEGTEQCTTWAVPGS